MDWKARSSGVVSSNQRSGVHAPAQTAASFGDGSRVRGSTPVEYVPEEPIRRMIQASQSEGRIIPPGGGASSSSHGYPYVRAPRVFASGPAPGMVHAGRSYVPVPHLTTTIHSPHSTAALRHSPSTPMVHYGKGSYKGMAHARATFMMPVVQPSYTSQQLHPPERSY